MGGALRRAGRRRGAALLLNVMRDQLDRFGEIDTTARAARQGRRGHDRARRAQPRRRAGRRAGARTSAASPTTASRPSCARPFPTDEELYGGPVRRSDLPAPSSCELLRRRARGAEADRCASTTSSTDVAAARRGSAQRAERGRRGGAGADARASTPDEVARRAGRGRRRRSAAGRRFPSTAGDVVLQLVKNPAGFRQTLRTLDDGAPDDGDRHRDQRRLRRRPGRLLALGRRLPRAARPRTRPHRDVRHPGGGHGGAAALRRRGDGTRSSPTWRRRCAPRSRPAPADAQVVVFSTYTAMWALHAILLRIGTQRHEEL